MILTLHNYWSVRGCAILQPYDMRVGAGTFHPATTLRSLGPEPWNVAYVKPSRSEEHTSELQSLMRISSAVVFSKKQIDDIRIIEHASQTRNRYIVIHYC